MNKSIKERYRTVFLNFYQVLVSVGHFFLLTAEYEVAFDVIP